MIEEMELCMYERMGAAFGMDGMGTVLGLVLRMRYPYFAYTAGGCIKLPDYVPLNYDARSTFDQNVSLYI